MVDAIAFEPPERGSWLLLADHFPDPVTPEYARTWIPTMAAASATLAERYGIPLARIEAASVHGYLYLRPVPLAGSGDRAMPPTAVLRLGARRPAKAGNPSNRRVVQTWSVGDIVRLAVGSALLTRVEYFDIALDPDSVALTSDEVALLRWAAPTWATADGQINVGQAIWVIESAGTTIVVDPCGASDAFLRTGPDAITHQEGMLAAMVAAGYPPESVDVVLLTHLDGIGLVAVTDGRGRWVPAFPNARIAISARELDHLATASGAEVSGRDALLQLVAQGSVDGVGDIHAVTDNVVLAHTGAHSPGHGVVRIEAGAERAIMVGHLAVSPLHTATGVCAGLNAEPEAAHRLLGELVAEAAQSHATLVGPLWPHPGAGTVDLTHGVEIVPIAR